MDDNKQAPAAGEMVARQGDVGFVLLERLPETARVRVGARPRVLALGEATGHEHAVLDGEVYVDERGVLFVEAGEETMIRHQTADGAIAEHAPFRLPKGVYEVRIEEDYLPGDLRRAVAD